MKPPLPPPTKRPSGQPLRRPSGGRPGRDVFAAGGLRAGVLLAADQIHESAVEPLPALLGASALLGAGVILGLDALMRSNAIAAHINPVISRVLLRELMPLVAALVLAVRSGAAVAVAMGSGGAQAGDGAPPLARAGDVERPSLLWELPPRAAGLALSAAAMTVSMAAAALAGGYFLLDALGRAPTGVRFGSLLDAIAPVDIALALGKAALAGAFIAVVSGVCGLRAPRAAGLRGSSAGLARAAGRGALGSALGCVVLLAAFALAPLAGAP